MGYIRHDAIIVTGMSKYVAIAHSKAFNLQLETTSMETSRINGECSFLIIPDGSKEGWTDSDEAEVHRQKWIKWAKEVQREIYFDWVWVSFGGDDPGCAHLVDFHGKENK